MKENKKLAMSRPTLRDWAKGISLNRKKNLKKKNLGDQEERTKKAKTRVPTVYYLSFEFCRTNWMIETKKSQDWLIRQMMIFTREEGKGTCLEVRLPPIQSGTILIPVGCGTSHVERVISRTTLRRL